MKSNVQILCTRPLDDQLVTAAKERGIDIDMLSFIETEPIESVVVQQEIEAVLNAAATVVFTSMNAVEAVAENMVDEQPEWNIYCIGNTTRQLVKQYFTSSVIAGMADNAAELADQVAGAYPEKVIFFCGDQRRDELPTILRQHDIEVDEIVVYQTLLQPHKIKKDYHGILFFSPSAVESFFVNNKLPVETILFAIGNTTAATIRKHANNRILVADVPGKEHLFEKMIEYFGG